MKKRKNLKRQKRKNKSRRKKSLKKKALEDKEGKKEENLQNYKSLLKRLDPDNFLASIKIRIKFNLTSKIFLAN